MVRLTREELEAFLVQCWLIWNQRNSVLHGGTLQDPTQLVQRAADVLEEYIEAQGQLVIPSHVEQAQRWEPPTGYFYKINVDAAVFAEMNASGFGVVVRNERAEVLASLVAKGPPVQNSEEAELLACRKALEFAVDAGFMDVVLEGDSLNVMQAISTGRANRSRLGHIYEDIQCLAAGFRSYSVSFVKRSANGVAHALARFAKYVDDELVWLEEAPPPALEALSHDSYHVLINE
ncbi:hypothetical protein SO802_031502 [Lithocarpus litseifolius]|uniref:RNase H type-1 domain-containing protein n=1 Tax=Lithocarpus litseifolius TaxID=425828 RepID=A0AAW2BKH6_9ROSI